MSLPGFSIRGHKLREAMIRTFGPLERRAIEEIWRHKEMSVRDMVLSFGRSIAYTTVMTTLDRLYKKGFLERRKVDRAYLYKAKFTRKELEVGLAGDVISGLIDVAARNVEPVLACIVDAVTDKDLELLDELERLVQEKKAAIAKKNS